MHMKRHQNNKESETAAYQSHANPINTINSARLVINRMHNSEYFNKVLSCILEQCFGYSQLFAHISQNQNLTCWDVNKYGSSPSIGLSILIL